MIYWVPRLFLFLVLVGSTLFFWCHPKPPFATGSAQGPRTWRKGSIAGAQEELSSFLACHAWGADNIGSSYIRVCGILWHVSFGVSPWRKASVLHWLLLLSQAEFWTEGHFQLHFSVMRLTLRWWQFPVTHVWHTWTLGSCFSCGALSSSSARCWGASTSRWGPGDLPEIGGSEPKNSMDFMIYGDFRYDFVIFLVQDEHGKYIFERNQQQAGLLSSIVIVVYHVYHVYRGVFVFSWYLLVFGRMQWR